MIHISDVHFWKVNAIEGTFYDCELHRVSTGSGVCSETLKHDYKDSHHLTGTAFRIEVVSINSVNKTKYLHEADGSVTSANKTHWIEIGKLGEAQGFHWGGNGGDDLFQKYTDANYGTGWNKNYFEFRDCGRRRGAKKYWSREKDADQWFELGCVPE